MSGEAVRARSARQARPVSEPRATTAREVALQVCRDVFGPNPRGAREALDYRLRKTELAPRDRAFATELAYGAIKMRRFLDFELQPFVGERAKSLPQPIAEILRLGHVSAARDARRRSVRGGVGERRARAQVRPQGDRRASSTRCCARVATEPPREADLATRASLPNWVVNHWRERFGDERLDAILAGVNAPAAAGVCVDLRNATRDEAQRALADAGHRGVAEPVRARRARARPGGARRPSSSGSRTTAGTCTREAASFPVDILDPQPGQRIVELCCGRGNKTLQIASRMRGDGALLAVDDDARKIAQTAARLDAAGIASVALVTADATTMQATRRRRRGAARRAVLRAWGSSAASPRRAGASSPTIRRAWRPCSAGCSTPRRAA